MRRFLIIFVSALGVSMACAGEPEKPWTFESAKLRPFWLCPTMEGESVFFIKDDEDAAPKASIYFWPTKILSVCSSSGEVTYVEGRDYVWHPGEREITLPAGSRIAFKTPAELRRPAGSQQYRLTHRDGNGEILFGAAHEYADMQAVVTYEHNSDAWPGPVTAFAGDQLPRTIGKLKAKQPLSIALLGDSISTGCNVSAWAKTPPFQPAYQDLLAMNLQSVYGAKVSLKNYSVGGMDTAWGLGNIGKALEADPDLLILAFGMNDSAGRPAAEYQTYTKGMIDAVRKMKPETEIILVATMLGSPDWVTLHPELFPQYRDALAQLCGRGVVLADMTSLWTELLKRKTYWDLTGNGVNHPNDFGHRIYAEVLSTLLIEKP